MSKIFDRLKKMVEAEHQAEKKSIETIERMKKQAEEASKVGEQIKAEKE